MPSNVDPKFLAETEGNYQKSLKLHDQYLETHGQISKNHRCFPTPFNKELKKKKKYKKAAAAEKKNSSKNVGLHKLRKFYPLFDKSLANDDLKDNALFICKEGEKWRQPETDKSLKCYYLNHGDPFIKLGPFKLEEKNEDPFVVLFKDFISSEEVLHYRQVAENNLRYVSF